MDKNEGAGENRRFGIKGNNMGKKISTEEAINEYEARAKELDILAMTKTDKHIKAIYEKAATRCKKIAERMRQLFGKEYHNAMRKYS